nr:hypothetical protein GCM10017611_76330 [Rhodococcus wratislaviensis]
MSFAQNNNQAPPEWEFRTDGPPHAPRLTATVRQIGLLGLRRPVVSAASRDARR